jgi:hypothetical protein
MNKFEAGGKPETDIEVILANAGVPEEYQNFARGIADLPPADRESQMAQMAEIEADFKENVARLRSFLSAYDDSHETVSAETSTEESPQSPSEVETEQPPAGKETADAEHATQNPDAAPVPHLFSVAEIESLLAPKEVPPRTTRQRDAANEGIFRRI